MIYTIKNNNLKVTIDSLGAEMVSVLYKGKERLWQNDNNTWTGHAPVLFPVAGNKEIIINGITYPMKQHGFARRCEFMLDYIKDDSIKLSLSENETSKEVYPFNFKISITYTLTNDIIKVIYDVENNSENDIYYSIGGHTSFKVNDELKNYNIILSDDKEVYSYNMSGRFITNKDLISKDGIIDLDTERLDNSNTIIIENIKSNKATLIKKNGEKVATIEYNGFKHFLIWHSLESKMVCLEPWHNLPDKESELGMELKDKNYIITLNPNKKDTYTQVITYFDNL